MSSSSTLAHSPSTHVTLRSPLDLSHVTSSTLSLHISSAVAHCTPPLPSSRLTSLITAALKRAPFLHELAVTLTGARLAPTHACALIQALQPLAQLRVLRLHGVARGCAGVAALADVLQFVPRLRVLDVRDALLNGGGEAPDFDGMLKPGVVEWLNAHGEDVGKGTSETKAVYVERAKALLEELGGSSVDSDGVEALQALGDALGCVPELRTLVLSGNGISSKGIAMVAAGLQHVQGLTELDVSDNPIGFSVPDFASMKKQEIVAWLGKQLVDTSGRKTKGEYREIAEQRASELLRRRGGEGMHRLSMSLQSLPSLTSLDISSCGIGHGGVAALAQQLQHVEHLRVLRAARNNFGGGGAADLAAALPSVPLLRVLDLSDNGIGVDGVTALSRTMSQLMHLRVLDLSRNDLSHVIVTALSRNFKNMLKADVTAWLVERGVRTSSRMRKAELIELAEQQVTKEKRRAANVLVVLAGMRSLETLNLSFMGVHDECIHAVTQALVRAGVRGVRADLSGNPIGQEGATAVRACQVLLPHARIDADFGSQQAPAPMSDEHARAVLEIEPKAEGGGLAELAGTLAELTAAASPLAAFQRHVAPLLPLVAEVHETLAAADATLAAAASADRAGTVPEVDSTKLDEWTSTALHDAQTGGLSRMTMKSLQSARRKQVEALVQALGAGAADHEHADAVSNACKDLEALLDKLREEHGVEERQDAAGTFVACDAESLAELAASANELQQHAEVPDRVDDLVGTLQRLNAQAADVNNVLTETLRVDVTDVARALHDNVAARVEDAAALRARLGEPQVDAKSRLGELERRLERVRADIADAEALDDAEQLLARQRQVEEAARMHARLNDEFKLARKWHAMTPEERKRSQASVNEQLERVVQLRQAHEETLRRLERLADLQLPEAQQVLHELRNHQDVPEVLQMLRQSGLVRRRDVDCDFVEVEELELPQSRFQMHVVQPVGSDELKVLKAFPVDGFKKIRNQVINVAGVEHPNVLCPELVFMDEDGKNVWVQYPYVEQGSLDRWVGEVCVPQRLEGEELLSREGYELMRGVFRELLDGVMHLHANGVVHNDIKPANVLMGEGDVPRICDFELSTQKNIVGTRALGSMTVRGLTVNYAAPEVMMNKRSTEKSDMYSLGRLMYDTMLHEWLALAEEHAAPAAGVMQARLPPGFDPREKLWAFPENVHPLFRELVEWLLQEEQDARPSAEVARAHPFFTRVLFEEKVEVDLGAVLQLDLHAALEERKLWQGDGGAGAPRRVQLDLMSPEALSMCKLFFHRGCQRRRVTSIERVENAELLRRFAFHKRHLQEKYGAAIEEQLVFHGTKPHVVDGIAEQGFDMRLNGSNVGTWYGKGNYFARDSSYSARDTYSPADGAGVKWMFVARILVGEAVQVAKCTNPAKQIKRPERKDGTPVDTAVDDLAYPEQYVTFNNAQAMPLYVIGFE